MDLQTLFIEPALFSMVLIYPDEQSPFIDCVASYYYERCSIGKISPKQQKESFYYYIDKQIRLFFFIFK